MTGIQLKNHVKRISPILLQLVKRAMIIIIGNNYLPCPIIRSPHPPDRQIIIAQLYLILADTVD